VGRQRNLLQVIRALGPPGRLPGRLHRRQEQRDQDTDDGNHHQQFDQCEGATIRSHWEILRMSMKCREMAQQPPTDALIVGIGGRNRRT
jgi:hypothetical protein